MNALLLRIGHYFVPIYPPFLIGITIADFVLHDNSLWYIANVAMMPLILAGIFGHIWLHGRKLCEQCIADIPLDPSALAEKRRGWMAHFHWEIDRKWPIFVPTVGFIASVATTNIWGFFIGNTVTLLLFSIPLSVSMVAGKWHHRLQPWCPYCRRGRGDDEEAPISPEPSPASA